LCGQAAPCGRIWMLQPHIGARLHSLTCPQTDSLPGNGVHLMGMGDYSNSS